MTREAAEEKRREDIEAMRIVRTMLGNSAPREDDPKIEIISQMGPLELELTMTDRSRIRVHVWRSRTPKYDDE